MLSGAGQPVMFDCAHTFGHSVSEQKILTMTELADHFVLVLNETSQNEQKP